MRRGSSISWMICSAISAVTPGVTPGSLLLAVTPGSLLVTPGGVQPEVSRHELWDLAVRHRIQGSVVLEPQGSFQGSPISSACARDACFPAWFTSRCSLTQLLRSEQAACSCRRCANPLLGTEWIFVMIIKEFKDAWKEDCERMWYGIMIVKRFISLLLASSSTKPYVKCSTWTSNSSWSSELPCLRICCKKCFL